MGSVFVFRGETLRSSNAMIEHLLERGEAVAVSRFPHGHPVPRFFGERRRAFFMGSVVDWGEGLGDRERREAADVLQAVAEEELRRESLGEPGLLWLRRDFARFLKGLRGEDPGPRPPEWEAESEAACRAATAPYERPAAEPLASAPARPSPFLLPAFGVVALGLAGFLYASGAPPRNPFAAALTALGSLALSRTFWRRWGL